MSGAIPVLHLYAFYEVAYSNNTASCRLICAKGERSAAIQEDTTGYALKEHCVYVVSASNGRFETVVIEGTKLPDEGSFLLSLLSGFGR
jgi:hypothetical protein